MAVVPVHVFHSLPEEDWRSELQVSESGQFYVSMSSSTFNVEHVKGIAHVRLQRMLTLDELRAMAGDMNRAADEYERRQKEWKAANARLNGR